MGTVVCGLIYRRSSWVRTAPAFPLRRSTPLGIYLTDLYPNFRWHPGVRLANAFKGGLAMATRSHVTLHFDSEQAIVTGFAAAGFGGTRVHLPESWYGVLDIPVSRIPSMVRVVENRV